MSILLGNLSVSQIENRLGIEFPEEIRLFMQQTHEPSANYIGKGKWHCFDIPFTLFCGDIETATKIYESVKDKSHLCKEALQFAISND